MTTHDRLITDHKILSVKCCANAKISIPKFIKTRPYHKLTKSALQKAFHMSKIHICTPLSYEADISCTPPAATWKIFFRFLPA